VYAKQYFNEKVITEDRYKLGEPTYVVPEKEGWNPPQENKAMINYPMLMQFYLDKVKDFEDVDPPEAFGQHLNAQISSQITDSNILLDSIISLQPQVAGASGEGSGESDLEVKIRELLETRVPEPLEMAIVHDKTKLIDN
jgi:dynein heavy chain